MLFKLQWDLYTYLSNRTSINSLPIFQRLYAAQILIIAIEKQVARTYKLPWPQMFHLMHELEEQSVLVDTVYFPLWTNYYNEVFVLKWEVIKALYVQTYGQVGRASGEEEADFFLSLAEAF